VAYTEHLLQAGITEANIYKDMTHRTSVSFI